jgi:flagellar basal body rod protein FlgB
MIEQVTLDLLQVAMDIKQAEHKTAAANIAAANIPGAQKLEADFSHLLQSLAQADNDSRALIISDIRQNWSAEQASSVTLNPNDDIKLDQETADLLLASGKFKLLAEGLNRKFGLMQVAVSGGKR